jgi:SAM-dependent methyltransferase
MKESVSPNLGRPLRFVKGLVRHPRAASYSLAKRLFHALPPSMRRRLETPARRVVRSLGLGVSRRLDLVEEIAWRFDVSEGFVKLYRQQDHGPIDWSKSNWEEFVENLPPVQKLSVPFAMSTVGRGRQMLSLLADNSCIRKTNRYLDVGTGYGGFLRASKEIGFNEAIGIELQPCLVELAKANVDGLPGATVLAGNFIADDFSRLGAFDLITCNDVIEHVDDAALAIQKMSTLLDEEGCLCFEVPNKDCITFVKSDGHFLIFGLTQLARDDAAAYHSAHTGSDRSVYLFEMGEMYELDWYLQKLAGRGLSARIVDTHAIGDLDDVPELVADLRQAYRQWREETKPKLEPVVAQCVDSAVQKYLNDLDRDFAELGDAASKTRFKDKYLRSFWTIIGERWR